MKHIFWIFVAMYTALIAVGCGNKGGGGETTTVVNTCVSLNAYGQCLDQNGVVTGVYSNTNGLNYFADNWSQQRTIQITDQQTYREFLRTTMGVCDRAQNNGGIASCSAWMNGGFDVIINVVSSTALNVVFRAWPQYNQGVNYWSMTPDLKGFILGFFGVPAMQTAGVYLNPMVLNTFQVYPINNSQGFEARSYGPSFSFGNRSLIQIRVEQGQLGATSLPFSLGYPNYVSTGNGPNGGVGTVFATGTLARCVTTNCSGGLW